MPMPPTTAPMIWLAASFGLRMRPAATAETTRVTRMRPSCSSTLTSAKTAECVLCAYLLFSLVAALASFSMRSARPARIVSASDLAVGEDDIVELCAGERRSRDLARRCQQLVLDLAAGGEDGAPDRGCREGAALDRRMGQRRIAEPRGHGLDGQSQHLGAELRHHRIGAGPDIGGGAGDLEAAIGGEHGARGSRHLHRVPDARRHAPADELAVLAHGARLRHTPRPAEALRALAIAFAQLLAAVRAIRALVALGIIDEAQLQRIDARGGGELIHRAFHRESALGA